MKKFYVMLAALIVALSASADYYLIGQNYNEWKTDQKYKFTVNPSNSKEYMLTVSELSGEFKIYDGNKTYWGRESGDTYYVSNNADYYVKKTGSDNVKITNDKTISYVTIYLSVYDDNQLKLFVKGVENPSYHLVGEGCGENNTTDWNNGGKEFEVNNDANKDEYPYKLEMASLGQSIKVNVGNWDLSWGSNGANLKVGTAYEASMGTDGNIITDKVLKNVTVYLKPFAGETGCNVQLYVIRPGAYLVGHFNDAADWSRTDHELTSSYDGQYAQTHTMLKHEDNLKFRVVHNSTHYVLDADELTLGTPTNLKAVEADSEEHIELPSNGVYTFALNTTSPTPTLTVNRDKEIKEDVPVTIEGAPETLYIIGNLESGSWSTTDPEKMYSLGVATIDGEQYEDYYIQTTLVKAGDSTPEAYFNFVSATSTNANDWDTVNASDRWGAATEGTTAELGRKHNTLTKYASNVNASACKSFSVTPGEYVIHVFINKDNAFMTMAAVDTVSVDGIEAAEEGEAVYYTLQGVKVAEPESGLYIKVVNGKASKVLVRK